MESVSDGKESVRYVNMAVSRQKKDLDTGPWVGALLRHCWQGVRAHIAQAAGRSGYSDLTPAHLALFRYPTLDGAQPTKLAMDVHLSKQAVNDLLKDLESYGYIRREPGVLDRRNRIIRLTGKGLKLEQVLRVAARDADRLVQAELGAAEYRTFRSRLLQISDFWKTHSGEPKA